MSSRGAHSFSVSAAAFVLGVIGVVVWKRQQLRTTKNNNKKEEKGDASSNEFNRRTARDTAASKIRLPAHIERQLYKEDRREQMRPMITMKKQMYDNVFMKDPNGKTLCTISIKKANWYVKKKLADWQDGNTIRLNFQPEVNKQSELKAYNVAKKENRCVVCGAENDYMRHYIIPYCYRSLFPDSFKTHLPHDVVILCVQCHVMAEQASHCKMRQMEHEARTRFHDKLHPTSAQAELVDSRIHQVKSAATALLKWQDKMPNTKIAEYEKTVQVWSGSSCLTLVLLQDASQLESRRPNPNYVSGATLIVKYTLDESDEDAIAEFVREWRRHFVNALRPKYMPVGWSIDAPVQSDKK